MQCVPTVGHVSIAGGNRIQRLKANGRIVARAGVDGAAEKRVAADRSIFGSINISTSGRSYRSIIGTVRIRSQCLATHGRVAVTAVIIKGSKPNPGIRRRTTP